LLSVGLFSTMACVSDVANDTSRNRRRHSLLWRRKRIRRLQHVINDPLQNMKARERLRGVSASSVAHSHGRQHGLPVSRVLTSSIGRPRAARLRCQRYQVCASPSNKISAVVVHGCFLTNVNRLKEDQDLGIGLHIGRFRLQIRRSLGVAINYRLRL
jgi:hypothetical protein